MPVSQWRGKKKVIAPFLQTVATNFAALLHVRRRKGWRIHYALKLSIIRYKTITRDIVLDSNIFFTGNKLVTICQLEGHH